MNRIRRRLTYANVMATVAVFIALGGTATAAVLVTSNSQVAKDTISGHKPPKGDHANIVDGSITGRDIADRSGVDTCRPHLTIKFGPVCAGSDGASRSWNDASQYCSDFGLRLPSISEALTLARNNTVPGTDSGQYFWTEDLTFDPTFSDDEAFAVRGDGSSFSLFGLGVHSQTVCVTDPSA
jgi:hypothetical protein